MHTIQQTGPMGISGQAGMTGGTHTVQAGFATTISVKPKFEEGSDLKVWATENGMYGMPSKAAAKMSRNTTVTDLYAALQSFAQTECDKAAEGLQGQMQQQLGGVNVAQTSIGIKWTPIISELKFEGDIIPRNTTEPVSMYLKDGEDFQACGTLKQEVGVTEKKPGCTVS